MPLLNPAYSSRRSFYLNMFRRLNPTKASPYLINYLKYKTSKRQDVIDLDKFLPQIAGLSLIKRCNLSCDFCSASKLLHDGEDGKWKETRADLKKIERILDHPLFSKILLVDLLGGEPLLVKELPDLVSYISQTGRLTNMVTNGFLLKRKIVQLNDAGISAINISIYDENLKILHRDLEAINKVFRVTTSLVLFRSELKESQDGILELIRFVHGAGCRALRFFIYRPMDTDPNLNDVIYHDDPDFVEFKARIDELFPGFILWPDLVKKDSWDSRPCAQLWQRIIVDMDGNISLCCGSEEQVGNIFSDSSVEVYNNSTMVEMRAKLLDMDSEPPAVCKPCSLLVESGW